MTKRSDANKIKYLTYDIMLKGEKGREWVKIFVFSPNAELIKEVGLISKTRDNNNFYRGVYTKETEQDRLVLKYLLSRKVLKLYKRIPPYRSNRPHTIIVKSDSDSGLPFSKYFVILGEASMLQLL